MSILFLIDTTVRISSQSIYTICNINDLGNKKKLGGTEIGIEALP